LKKTFLAKRIKKTSRRKQWISFFVILFCVISLLIQGSNALFNVNNLPQLTAIPTDEEAAAQMINYYRFFPTSDPTKFEVTLDGTNGIIKFYPLADGTYLPVFTANNFQNPHPDFFYGQLTALTDDQRTQIETQITSKYDDVDANDVDAFVQYKILIVSAEPKPDIPYSIILGIILIYCLWVWFRNRHFKRKPQNHKVFKAFAREGGEVENFHQFNDEIEQANSKKFKHIILTDHWLFYNGKLRLKLRNIGDIVCVFKTKSLENSFITRWATRKMDVVVCFIDKRYWNLKFKKNYSRMDEFKEALCAKLPNIVTSDDDKELSHTWFNKPDEILERYSQNVYHSTNQEAIKERKEEAKQEEEEEKTITENIKNDIQEDINSDEKFEKPHTNYIEEPKETPSWTRRKKKGE